MYTIVSLVFLILFSTPLLCARLDSASCTFLNARGFCSSVDIQAVCPSHCTPPCSNIMPDSGCNIIKNIGGCRNDTFFPLCRKTCFGCDVLYTSLGCFIDQNGNRIMPTTLHQDFNDPNIVKDCSQRASAAGFSVFGVEAGGQCFSGVNAGLSFKKHGQAPDEDCINGEGANFRMSVYKFGTLHQGLPAQACPQPLGMENGQILDSQITASSEFDSNHRASNGRLNFAAGAGRTGAWSARTSDVNQWLQVDLLGKPKVTAIMTQGRGDCSCNQFVKSYTISYSDSGSTFTSYPEGSQAKVFDGNADKDTIVSHPLSPAINARYIRVEPKTWNEHISMRIELVGCHTVLDDASCTHLQAQGFCSNSEIQAKCQSQCQPSCSNYMSDGGCNIIKANGECNKYFPLCRKTCFKCAVLYKSLGCFIDQNGDRIMPTTLHQDFNDPNIVIDCAQRASAAGFSVFGVEAGGQCFSGANAGVTFKKHGQAPDGDCINGEGANFRMSVYKFV